MNDNTLAPCPATGDSGTARPGEVQAELRFTVPQDDAPIVYLVDYASTTIKLESRQVTIRNARALENEIELEQNGFALVEFTTGLQDVRDKHAVDTVFRQEAESLLQKITGAKRVVMFASLARDMRFAATNENLGAATNVHVDHDQATYEYSIRQVLPPDEANELLQRRWAAYNIWKPLRTVESMPLAVCDARTIRKEDLIPTAVGTSPDEPLLPRTGLGVLYRSDQNWYYYPLMTADEALILKMWDTDQSRPQWAAHSAFDDPTSPTDAQPRVSLDARFVVFF
ncbi:hypothetical protein GJV26_02430 [Massilia dura]|uniref:Methyltransferase n=1 Tax=Pseudoduganella dura TaxID=321982 RepID=A0A6I3X3C4_9BURK|nr:CmcJ/NvfI family oxidoreductase [Pseudoduganella dura]MUI11349.1 hypothetical protein [Pseudoduganella dura]GGX95577.1 hypothetical protein GCM10007386_28080 [Pseudoduganella dura]